MTKNDDVRSQKKNLNPRQTHYDFSLVPTPSRHITTKNLGTETNDEDSHTDPHHRKKSSSTQEDTSLLSASRIAPGYIVAGHYVLKQPLGTGGMGSVFLAEHRISGQTVAIKTLLATNAQDPLLKHRFIEEARALASLDHPHIVPMLTFAQEGDDLFLVMKYIDGLSLDQWIEQFRPVPFELVQNIFKSILEALQYLHSRGIVHRDIKPANIIIHQKNQLHPHHVYIVDFGIAKKDHGDHQLTNTGILVGTPQYMAPEQISMSAHTHQTDLYSAGLLLYELLAGEPAFQGEKTFDILKAQVEKIPPLPSSIRRENIPSSLESLCMMLLNKDPQRRPSDAAAALILLYHDEAHRPGKITPRHHLTMPDIAPYSFNSNRTHPSNPGLHAPTSSLYYSTTNQQNQSSMTSGELPSHLPQEFHLSSSTEDDFAIGEPSRSVLRKSSKQTPLIILMLIMMIASGFYMFFFNTSEDFTKSNISSASLSKTSTSNTLAAQSITSITTPSSTTNTPLVTNPTTLPVPTAPTNPSLSAEAHVKIPPPNASHENLSPTLVNSDQDLEHKKPTHIQTPVLTSDAKEKSKEKTIKKVSPPISLPDTENSQIVQSGKILTSEQRVHVRNQHIDALQSCYQSMILREQPTAEGELNIEITVIKNGSVKSVDVRRSSFEQLPFLTCVIQNVRTWNYPAFDLPETISFQHTFKFQP